MAKTTDPTSGELDLSAAGDQSVCTSRNRSLRVAEKERRKEDSFVLALKYFSEVEQGTSVRGNVYLENNLLLVERMAYSKGLPPEAISVMLEFAMSLRMGSSPCVRVLKSLIPASLVPQECVVRALVWLCVSKIPSSTQILFLKWVLTFFDMIEEKDRLRAIYGFIFSLVSDESLCPFVCHLLYLLTRKENVRPFRFRKLVDLQTRMGKQPFLYNLLFLYKVFCPELVMISRPSHMRTSGFKNHNAPWKMALLAVQRRNKAVVSSGISLDLGVKGKKRKRQHLELPALMSAVHLPGQNQTDPWSSKKVVPLVQIHSFPQLLQNLHRIELPVQMGSLLGSSLTLHYLNCLQDESAFLRLDFWLTHALQEEFLFCGDKGTSQGSDEVLTFLERILSTQHFLQEGFSSTEGFLYKLLPVWDGSLFQPQILGLLSSIPVVPSSRISQLLFEPLMQLFFTSSVFFKCAVIDCLNSMLQRWLTWHSVYALVESLDISINSHASINMTLSGFKDSVLELVQFVGRLASLGLQLESCHGLLLHVTLDFYQTVCDIFLKYELPLLVMPPAGVFYPAILATNPITVDRLAHIMTRYKINLTSARSQEKNSEQAFHISRQVYQEFNQYVSFMVNCLWNNKVFQPGAPDLGGAPAEELLARSGVAQPQASLNLIHHPAFLGYAVRFHHQCWPERRDTDLNSIRSPKQWGWYLEYLFDQGFQGLQQFIESNIAR